MPFHHIRDWAPGWGSRRARDSSLPISIATFTQWTFCSSLCLDLGCFWNYTCNPAVFPKAFRSSPRTGRQTGSSCRLNTCLRCSYTAANARLWPYACFGCANAGAGPPSCPLSQHTPSPPPQPLCGTAAHGQHKEIHMGSGNLENTWIWVISVRLGAMSPKTTQI